MSVKFNMNFKPRSSQEATDLGWILARTYYWPLFRLSMSFCLPFFFLSLFLGEKFAPLCLLACWWLKIFWERPLLYYLSLRLLKQKPSYGDCLKKAPSLFAQDFLASLLWRRLSFSRSMDMPIRQLEGLKGKARAQRRFSLHTKPDSTSLWLTVFCFSWEIGLAFAMMLVFVFFIPPEMLYEIEKTLHWLWEQSRQYFFIAPYLSMALVAPFYVSAGFSLYLNRRTQMEAWDLQQVFEGLKERFAKSRFKTALIIALLLLPKPIWALEQKEITKDKTSLETKILKNQDTRQEHRQEIENLLTKPPFKRTYTTKEWHWKGEKKEKEKESYQSLAFFDWLYSFISGLHSVVRLLLWVLFGGIFLIFLYWWKPWNLIKNLPTKEQKSTRQPTTIKALSQEYKPSLKLDQEAFNQAKLLFESGNYRQALSLLYRLSLKAFEKAQSFSSQASQTEGEILKHAQSNLEAEDYDFLKTLIHYWKKIAYAHESLKKEPLESLFQQGIHLIKRSI